MEAYGNKKNSLVLSMIEAERIKDIITNKIQYKDAYENFYVIFLFKCVRKSLNR